jgi:hypothetical protein
MVHMQIQEKFTTRDFEEVYASEQLTNLLQPAYWYPSKHCCNVFELS